MDKKYTQYKEIGWVCQLKFLPVVISTKMCFQRNFNQ